MKGREDFLQLLDKIEGLPIGKTYAGDNSIPVPKSENAEIYQRAVFDIPISGRKHVRFAHCGTIREAVLKPGDILFSASGIWKITEWDLPHELFCLVFRKEYLRFTYVDYRKVDPEYKRPVCCNYCHTHLPPSPLILELLRNLITLNRESQNTGAARFLMRSIISLSRDFLQKDELARFNGKKERTFQHLMEYLSENFTRQISREEIAKVFHLNPCYVSRLFREKYGKTFCEVLCDLRMEHAAYLLTFDDLLIDEIAMLCGYMSTQTFTIMFRQHFGLPPGKYRVMNHHNHASP
ncbi:MAG: helix-turn-helix transcriptional regulator [Lentisphaeria bacterium]|nr:helix-turn-helix transcriptional regulator [Lentisphaeria bacterium]